SPTPRVVAQRSLAIRSVWLAVRSTTRWCPRAKRGYRSGLPMDGHRPINRGERQSVRFSGVHADAPLLGLTLEHDPNRDRQEALGVRAAEDVRVPSLEVHPKAAQGQIVAETRIEAEVPVDVGLLLGAKYVSEYTARSVVSDSACQIQTAIVRRLAEVIHSV